MGMTADSGESSPATPLSLKRPGSETGGFASPPRSGFASRPRQVNGSLARRNASQSPDKGDALFVTQFALLRGGGSALGQPRGHGGREQAARLEHLAKSREAKLGEQTAQTRLALIEIRVVTETREPADPDARLPWIDFPRM